MWERTREHGTVYVAGIQGIKEELARHLEFYGPFNGDRSFIFFKNPHPRTGLLILERGEWRERERERNTDAREKHRSLASHTCPDWGPKPATWARALTSDQKNLRPLSLWDNALTN